MPNILAIDLHPLGSETVAGAGAAVDIGAERSGLVIEGEVYSIASGALALTIETSADNSTWRHARTLNQAHSAGPLARVAVLGLLRYVRASWTVSGAVSFSLPAKAHAVYAGTGDSRHPAHLLRDMSPNVIAEEFIKASSMASDRVGVAYSLPLSSWGPGLTSYVADIADYHLLHHVGYDPDSIDTEVYIARHQFAMKALEGVARGTVKLDGVADATPEVEEAGAYVYSAPSRGWYG